MSKFTSVIKYANELRQLPYSLGDEARILFQDKADTFSLKLSDDPVASSVRSVRITDDYAKAALISSGYDYMIVASSPLIELTAAEGKSLPAVLDDMGMIIGLKAHYIDSNIGGFTKHLKNDRACINSDGYALCCGVDMYEAFTCYTILAKNAEIYHKAKVLGGAKPIKLWPGLKEKREYNKKYSKLERSK